MPTLRNLDIRHLVALDAVATEGTFGRAAERLGYTQSAVSQQIATLERIVGDPVFDRPGGPRPVELTPLGALLLDHGRRLLAQLDAVDADLDRFRNGDLGTLRVGTFQSVSATVLPLVVGPMRTDHPHLDITVVESDIDDDLRERVASGELDISFLVGQDADVESRHVLTDPFVLLARPGQFPTGPVATADLSGLPFIGQHENSCQLLNESGLRKLGIEPNYVFRSNDNGTVAAMVRAGMGIAVMPMLCTDPDDARISLHPLDPPIPDREISIVWRRGHSLAPAARRFVDLAVEAGAAVGQRVKAARQR